MVFNKDELLDEFFIKIDPAKQNLAEDLATVEWWAEQDEASRENTFGGTISLDAALGKFSTFCRSQGEFYIWSRGPEYDIASLSAAYAAVKRDIPWKYFNTRCHRTMEALAPHICFKRGGVRHHALDDAKYQALFLQDVWKAVEK